jgi:hypothetical protein
MFNPKAVCPTSIDYRGSGVGRVRASAAENHLGSSAGGLSSLGFREGEGPSQLFGNQDFTFSVALDPDPTIEDKPNPNPDQQKKNFATNFFNSKTFPAPFSEINKPHAGTVHINYSHFRKINGCS